jgi:hypothetical protein
VSGGKDDIPGDERPGAPLFVALQEGGISTSGESFGLLLLLPRYSRAAQVDDGDRPTDGISPEVNHYGVATFAYICLDEKGELLPPRGCPPDD